jgi:hypothetical protein
MKQYAPAAAGLCVLLLFAAAILTERGSTRSELVAASMLAAKTGHKAAMLHSAGYYNNLAAADSWEMGPSSAALAAGPDVHIRRGREQLLAQVESRRLSNRGKALVKLCSAGNDQACTQIASNPRELRALEAEEAAQNQQAKQLHLRASHAAYAQDPQIMAGVRRAANSMTNQLAMEYQDQADAKNIWDASNWQSGALGDVVSNQWLAACGQGNAAACNHIARSNGALQALLTSSSTPGPPIEAYMPIEAPKPVFVAAKQPKAKPGMLTDVMNFLGLSDNFDKSGVRSSSIPKMVPDVGFHKGHKYNAVWNDGTIAPVLSDNEDAKKFYKDAGKVQLFDFSDTVKQRDQPVWKPDRKKGLPLWQ